MDQGSTREVLSGCKMFSTKRIQEGRRGSSRYIDTIRGWWEGYQDVFSSKRIQERRHGSSRYIDTIRGDGRVIKMFLAKRIQEGRRGSSMYIVTRRGNVTRGNFFNFFPLNDFFFVRCSNFSLFSKSLFSTDIFRKKVLFKENL